MDKIYFIPTEKKVLCPTFDDGPEPNVTPIILDILKNYNIKSTFFVLIENVLKYPVMLKRIINDGHSVGLHGLNHISYRKHTKDNIYEHIKRGIDILHDSFGVDVKYFRPPYGTLPQDAETACKEFGLTPIGWTIMVNDWKHQGIENKSKDIIRKCSNGKILVLHDGYRCSTHTGVTVEVLKNILPILINQGYSFVSIPELIASKSNLTPNVFNNIPLLYHEIIDYNDKTTLLFYWDVNYIKSNDEYFDLRIANVENISMHVKYPSPNAMEEWHRGIEFPLNGINKDSGIFINNIKVNSE